MSKTSALGMITRDDLDQAYLEMLAETFHWLRRRGFSNSIILDATREFMQPGSKPSHPPTQLELVDMVENFARRQRPIPRLIVTNANPRPRLGYR